MRTFIYKTAQIVLVLLILATILHAFYQSSLPTAESVKQSSKVEQIIEEIIPPDTSAGEFVKTNIRKLAHFTEFFMLGLWSALFVLLLKKKKGGFIALLPFGLIVALLDETVQIFSNRGSSVKDVWIDAAGYVCAVITVLFVTFVAFLVKKTVSRGRS